MGGPRLPRSRQHHYADGRRSNVLVIRGARKSRFGRPCSPRLRCDAPEGEAGGAEPPAVSLDDGRDRDEREGIGGAVTDLAIDLAPARWRRQCHGGDHFAGLERRLDMGRVARQPIEFVDRQRALAAVGGDRFDASVERRHRDGHVGGMNGGAIRAGAEDAEAALEAAECRASGAGLALVAGHGRVVEIRAARALEQIAGGGGLLRNWPDAPARRA